MASDGIEINGRLMKVDLANQCLPVFQYTNKKWVKYGEFNNYPDYIIELYNRNAFNGTIIKGKSSFVFGKGLKPVEGTLLETVKTQASLDYANRYENWNDVIKKTVKYLELFNGFAWQIIWNKKGTIAEVYCMEFAKLRRSKNGKKVYYCDNWVDEKGQPVNNPENESSFKEYDLFNPNIRTGTSVLYYMVEHPTTQKYGHLYPIPEYGQCTADIETDIEITSFHFHNLKNGMFASALMTTFEGEPTPEQKKKLAKMFNYTHSGTLNTGKLIFYFGDKGGTPPDLKTLVPADLDKQFEQLGKRLQQNIFVGHGVNPMLFGIQTDNGISTPTADQMLVEWEKFQNKYIELRQEIVLNEFEIIRDINGIGEVEFVQASPLSAQLPIDANILGLFDKADLQKHFAKKYGIEISEPAVSQPSITVQQEGQINEHIKNLTGKQWIQIKRLIREVNKGTTTRDVAKMLIKTSTGLGNIEIDLLLKTPENTFNKFEVQKKEDELMADLFEACAVDDNDDEIISEEFVTGQLDVYRKALKFQTADELNNSVLDLLKGNPDINPDELAKRLGSTPDVIAGILEALIVANLIEKLGNAFQPTQKGLDKIVPNVQTEIYTVYKYVKRDGVPDAVTSRPFCRRLMALSSAGKRWTRDAIDSISASAQAQLAMPELDPWTYRGGFYTNPNTDETTPYCRHLWRSVTKTRRIA